MIKIGEHRMVYIGVDACCGKVRCGAVSSQLTETCGVTVRKTHGAESKDSRNKQYFLHLPQLRSSDDGSASVSPCILATETRVATVPTRYRCFWSVSSFAMGTASELLVRLCERNIFLSPVLGEMFSYLSRIAISQW